MAVLDWACCVVLLGSGLLGAMRGLVWEVVSLLGWVASFWVARQSSGYLAQKIGLGASSAVSGLVYFAVVFVLCLFVFGLVSALLKRGVKAVGLRPIDRSLGLMFGLFRGFVVLLALTALVQLIPLKSWQGADLWRESHVGAWLTQALGVLGPLLPNAPQSASLPDLPTWPGQSSGANQPKPIAKIAK